MIVEQMDSDSDGSSVIRHKQYGEKVFKTDKTFRPYFYVDAAEGYYPPGDVDASVERNVGVRAYDGTELHKVTCKNARDVRKARDAAKNHFEADIPFVRRYYIDRVRGSLMNDPGDISAERPHVVHADIEIKAEGGGVDPIDADKEVISISMFSEANERAVDLLLKPAGWEPDSAVDDKGREYIDPDWEDETPGRVYLFDDERNLLRAFGAIIRKTNVEVLTGWNFAGFDAPYLVKRCEALEGVEPAVLSPLREAYTSVWTSDLGKRKISTKIKGVDILDMMDAYKHLKRREKPPNWRLDTVAKHEGAPVEKMDFDTAYIGEHWQQDPLAVMKYNRRDAVLTHHINESLSALDLFLEIHRAFGIPLADTIKNSVLVEMYVMKRSPEWGIRDRVLDSKRTEVNDFEGGNTKSPNAGLYDWVFSADVTSEYPNWVRAANMSPETVVLETDEAWNREDLITTPKDGIRFLPHEKRLGILPRAVDEMFGMKQQKTEERSNHEYGSAEYRQADMERDATKWFLNSIQGVTGMETHRLSKNEVSAAITAFGRHTVEKMVDVGQSLGYDFVYGDTDSAFFTADPTEVNDLGSAVAAVRELVDKTNRELPVWAETEFNIQDDRRYHLEVEPDKVAKKAFFPERKKRYTLWLAWNDGTEIDKIDHTGWDIVRSDTSHTEERVQRKTLEALIHGKDERYITENLLDEIDAVVSGDYGPLDLARPQGSSKPFELYGTTNDVDFESVPYFVSAMLSSNELLGTDYAGGDKTWMLPVEEDKKVELNGTVNRVNYLAIDEDVELPDWVRIDYEKCIQNVIDKVDGIYTAMGWSTAPLEAKKREAMSVSHIDKVRDKHHTLGSFSS